MRKFAVVAALAVLGAAFAGAQERSVHAVGLTVPLWNQSLTVMDDDEYDITASAVGINLMYHHLKVSENHFSSFIDVEWGYTSVSIDEIEMNGYSFSAKDVMYGTELDGFNTRFMFGLGGAPLVNDFVTLAVHGTFGVNLLYAACEDSYKMLGVKVDASSAVLDLWTTVGVNVEAAFRFTGHFGVFAGVNMYTNLFGFGVYANEVSVGSYTPIDTADFFLVYPGKFNVDFRVGVAFTY